MSWLRYFHGTHAIVTVNRTQRAIVQQFYLNQKTQKQIPLEGMT